jgi:xylulokinase
MVVGVAGRDRPRRKADAALVEGTEQAGKLRGELASNGAWALVSSLPAAPATMRRRPAAWAPSAKVHAFVSLGTSGVLFAANGPTCRSRKAPCMPSATRCPTPGTRWASSSATDALNWYSHVTGKSAADLTRNSATT